MPKHLPMINQGHVITAMLSLFTLSHVHLAAAAAIECPAEVAAKAIHLDDTPPGWQFHVQSPLYLHSAAPMSTAPEKRGYLKPDKEEGKAGRWSYTYVLEGPPGDGKWLQCGYGAHNELTLSKKLADDTKVCVIKLHRGAKVEQNIVQIDCQ